MTDSETMVVTIKTNSKLSIIQEIRDEIMDGTHSEVYTDFLFQIYNKLKDRR
jgi:hypothetical protein